MDQPIYIHERHHEARRAAARVLVDPLHVLIQPNRRRSDAVERTQALPIAVAAATQLVVPSDELLQHAGEDGEDSRRDRRVVAARLRQPRLAVLWFAAAGQHLQCGGGGGILAVFIDNGLVSRRSEGWV